MQKGSSTKENLIIYVSMILIFLSVYLFLSREIKLRDSISNLTIESVNIKNMSTVKISYKNGVDNYEDISNTQDTILSNNVQRNQDTLASIQQINAIPEIKWQLPTKTGWITTYPNYNHVAFDITSGRGVNEIIYPIANGTVSGLYYDSAGAMIVTVHHYIDGINYTSQYVHLSSYAPGIYVGKEVTVNDPIGQMGRTGIATGVHLHITVVDNCVLFDPNDVNCKDINSFYRYIKLRYTQGFTGLNNLIEVPNNW